MSSQNALTLTTIALQLATQLQQLMATQARAHAEGRDVSDEEVAASRDGATAAIEALKATKG